MSTTRWIIETPCQHGEAEPHSTGPESTGAYCSGGSSVVVDPDNLPPERVERAGIVIAGSGIVEVLELDRIRSVTAEAVRAFLSDPEPGEQGLKVAWSEMYPEPGDQT